MKKVISVLIALSVVFTFMPAYSVQVEAASDKYMEAAKDSVPLRNNYGSEYDIQSRINSKGTVVKILKKEFKWSTFKTWYKVQIASGVTNNGKYGDFWVYDGNLTKHSHKLSAGACSSKGCSYKEDIKTVNSDKITVKVVVNKAPMRKAPYNDGEVVKPLDKGELLSVTKKIQNYKGSYWYKLKNGYYIFEDNVKKSEGTVVAPDDGGSDSSVSTFCNHKWSVGKCTNCQATWVLSISPATGTYKAKEDTIARDIPYKQGKEMKKYQKGDILPIVGIAENSAKNIWYKTSDGYWIYAVEDVSLKSVYLSTTNYTFRSKDDHLTPEVTISPKNACVTKSWSSSNSNVASVGKNTGKILPEGEGEATITCTVTSLEGIVKKATIKIVVTEDAFLEEWNYSNTKFEYNLALECSAYSSLAYPRYDYTYDNGKILVYSTGSDPTMPKNLTRLLSEKNFNYEISANYPNKTRNNSPYVLAHKNVKYNGEKTPVIYVIIQGSAGRPGWEGNMMITGSDYDSSLTTHKTFDLSASDMQKGLDKYIKEHKLSNPLVVITGHSRGAGAGNLLADNILSKNPEKTPLIECKAVYAYLFATPNTTKKPIKYNNVFNICNESDFVPYIPLSSSKWGYEKHGEVYSFSSVVLGSESSGSQFNTYATNEFKRSNFARKPDYKWCSDTPSGMRDYMKGKWKNTYEYYHHNTNTYTQCNVEAYDYFFNGLASAAGGGSDQLIRDHLHIAGKCPFKPISWFFAGNASELNDLVGAFRDCHEMMTYHAAMLSKKYNSGGGAELFWSESYGNGSVALNQDEYDALYSFFCQKENELMLELAGWDIENPETWEGVYWNNSGNIVKLDLSYLNLSGWLNANNFPEIQELNIDGNSLTMLAVSECSKLVELSCMANDLSSLYVEDCDNLQNLYCGFNKLSSLNVSGMSQISELNCFGNNISKLNLSGATALQTVRCGNNELSTVDISTNTSLNTFYCNDNRIIESNNTELLKGISAINENGGSAIIGSQKYNENYDFNASELASLTELADNALNLEKLEWDMENPYTWNGVEWKIINGEYHVTNINFDGLELEGDFNFTEAQYVESVSCENSSLTSINLSGCENLSTLNCYGSEIASLEIKDCTSLSSVSCNENYLEVEEVESSLSQIGLSTGTATYETQNIDADEANFNSEEREILISFLSTGFNADALDWDWNWPGTWDGIVWTKANGEYRVNKIDFAAKDVCGKLDLSAFEYLEDFDFGGTQIETVILPDSIVKIPECAFYNSEIKYVYMSEGVVNIEKSAFAYCDNLNTLVLPKSIAKIMDNAFYGSKNLKSLVFVGDEPLIVGEDIAGETSSEFKIMFFADSEWTGTTDLMNDYLCVSSEDDYLLLWDEDIELKEDSYYNEENKYNGDMVNLTVISKVPGDSSMCIFSVYDEGGRLNNLVTSPVEMNSHMTVISFEDINLQFVGEEYCTIKAFLWNDTDSLQPLTKSLEKALIKPIL